MLITCHLISRPQSQKAKYLKGLVPQLYALLPPLVLLDPFGDPANHVLKDDFIHTALCKWAEVPSMEDFVAQYSEDAKKEYLGKVSIVFASLLMFNLMKIMYICLPIMTYHARFIITYLQQDQKS